MRTGRPRRVTRRVVRRVWVDGTDKIRHATAQAGWAGGLFALRVTRRGYLETRRLGGLVTPKCGNCKGDEVFACAVLLSFSSIRGALVA